MTEQNRILHNELLELAAGYKNFEGRIISRLQDFDKSNGYKDHECTSLFQYCVKVLGLSEAVTYNFTTLARRAVDVPELKECIASGELTVAKARKIVPVINKENKDQWLSLAKTVSTRELEKAVAHAQPKLAIKESVKHVAENTVVMTTALSEKVYENIKRIMDLESQRTKKASSRDEALLAATEAYLEQNDPLRKAARAQERAQKKDMQKITCHVTGNAGEIRGRDYRKTPRTKFHAALVHAVNIRDQRQCTHTDVNGNRCGATRWLDVHHIVPRSHGGADSLENLTTLCSAHHRMIHQTS